MRRPYLRPWGRAVRTPLICSRAIIIVSAETHRLLSYGAEPLMYALCHPYTIKVSNSIFEIAAILAPLLRALRYPVRLPESLILTIALAFQVLTIVITRRKSHKVCVCGLQRSGLWCSAGESCAVVRVIITGYIAANISLLCVSYSGLSDYSQNACWWCRRVIFCNWHHLTSLCLVQNYCHTVALLRTG